MRVKDGWIAFIFIFAIGLGNMGSTLYAPAMVRVATAFSASPSIVKLTFALFLLFFALSQVVYGPLSEIYGRRKLLICGTGLFFASSVFGIFATNIWMLLIARCLQGVGIGCTNTLGYAIARDAFEGHRLTRVLGFVGLMGGIVTAMGIFCGGLLVHAYSWQGVFWLMAAIAFVFLFMLFFLLYETKREFTPEAKHFSFVLHSFKRIFVHPESLGYTIACSFVMASYFVLNSMLPFYMVSVNHYSLFDFSWIVALMNLGICVGSLLGAQFAIKMSTYSVVVSGLILELAVLILAIIFSGNVLFCLVMFALVFFCVGATFPLCARGVVGPFPDIAGYATAIFATICFGSIGLVVAIGAQLTDATARPTSILLAVTIVISLLGAFWTRREVK